MSAAPAGVLALHEPALLRSQAYLGGHWCDADGGGRFEVRDPATGQVLAQVPLMGASETRRAIDAACKAWPAWRARMAAERAEVMQRWASLIRAHREDLAWLMTSEQGKPLSEARNEITSSAAFIQWFAEEAIRLYGQTVPSPWADRRLLVWREPIGVCAAVTPWNFPAAMIARKVGPALAAGNPMIVKPAEATPLSALALAVLAERAGIPPGILSVLTGEPAAIGETLCADPRVRKLSFTGSTAVGRRLYAQCAPTLKKLSMELGGNAPLIVFDDADLDAAVAGAMQSKFRNSGQTCVCANRIYVQSGIYERFAQRLINAVKGLRVGDGRQEGVTQGPLINAAAVTKIERQIADALRLGARVLTGGQRHALGGTFFEPTVIGEASARMMLAQEETFGPLAPLFRFDTEEEVIRAANDNEAGLAGYFFSRDVGRIWRVAEALECGMVGVNAGLISTEVAPFGGIKQSGFGREGSHFGIDEYLQLKYVALGGLNG